MPARTPVQTLGEEEGRLEMREGSARNALLANMMYCFQPNNNLLTENICVAFVIILCIF